MLQGEQKTWIRNNGKLREHICYQVTCWNLVLPEMFHQKECNFSLQYVIHGFPKLRKFNKVVTWLEEKDKDLDYSFGLRVQDPQEFKSLKHFYEPLLEL